LLRFTLTNNNERNQETTARAQREHWQMAGKETFSHFDRRKQLPSAELETMGDYSGHSARVAKSNRSEFHDFVF
jgi:hypothetical protein